MTDREDRFADELDALTHGEPIPDADDVTRFAAEARSVWSHGAAPPSGVPLRLTVSERRRLWESIRQEATVSRSSHEGSTVMSGHTLAAPVTTSRPTGWGATAARWQPVLSIAVMFALLFGLVGIAYTGLNRRDNDPSPTVAGLIAQGTPSTGVSCEPYGPPALSQDEIKEMSWSDWPRRQYIPVAPVDPEIGQQIVDVYENWYACSLEWSVQRNSIEKPQAAYVFSSERMQYQSFFMDHPEQRPQEIEDWSAFDPNWVIQSGSLPLNRPTVHATAETIGGTFQTFSPGDVYQLSDGRYGVVVGSISTILLAASQPESNLIPDPDNNAALLHLVAFTESGGYYLIDEYQSICVVPIVAKEKDGWESCGT